MILDKIIFEQSKVLELVEEDFGKRRLRALEFRFCGLLWWEKFSLGETAVVYITLNESNTSGLVELSNGINRVVFGVSQDELRQADKHNLLVEIIAESLFEVARRKNVDTEAISKTRKLLLQEKEKAAVPLKQKSTKKYDFELVYTLEEEYPPLCNLFLNLTRKSDGRHLNKFITKASYEEIRALCSKISLKGNVVTISPRASEGARFYISTYFARSNSYPPLSVSIEPSFIAGD